MHNGMARFLNTKDQAELASVFATQPASVEELAEMYKSDTWSLSKPELLVDWAYDKAPEQWNMQDLGMLLTLNSWNAKHGQAQ